MKNKPTQKLVAPGGVLGIETASPLRQELLAALAGSDEVLFDFSGAEDIDLAVLQVLYAARRSAELGKVRFSLMGKVSEKISKRLQVAGFTHSPCRTGEELETSLVDYGSATK